MRTYEIRDWLSEYAKLRAEAGQLAAKLAAVRHPDVGDAVANLDHVAQGKTDIDRLLSAVRGATYVAAWAVGTCPWPNPYQERFHEKRGALNRALAAEASANALYGRVMRLHTARRLQARQQA